MDPDTYALICEGSCNPNLAAIDARVQDNVRHVAFDGTCIRVNPRTASLQRSLVHTPHVLLGGDEAECILCNTLRPYGRTTLKWAPLRHPSAPTDAPE